MQHSNLAVSERYVFPRSARLRSKSAAALFLFLTACGGSAICSAQSEPSECVAHPEPVPGDPSMPPDLSGARLILEDSFDQQDNFTLPRIGTRCIREGDPDCALLPRNWTNFYSYELWHPVDQQDASLHGSMEISGFQDRGGSGKSLTIWDESQGGPSRWGSDALLARAFEDSKDVYAEFYIRFQPGYRWHGIEDGVGLNMAKLFRFTHFDGGGGNPFRFFDAGYSAPMVILDLHLNGREGGRASLQSAVRCDPQESNYRCGRYQENRGDQLGGLTFHESIGDGAWHKIGVRASINSAPGVSDGTLSVWFDDQLIGSRTDVPYLGAGSPATHGWNMVMVGGNMHNLVAPESERLEQWHSIDDVRIYRFD